MRTSILKHTKKQFLPMTFGAFCVFNSVEKFFKIISCVASLISKFFVNLYQVRFIFTNKALVLLQILSKPLEATFLRGFFYCNNLTNVNLS